MLRGEYSRAEQVLRATDLKGDPYSVIALADFYLESLRAKEAEQVLDHAATILSPEHQDIVGRRGLALLLRGESEKGLALLQTAWGKRVVPVCAMVRCVKPAMMARPLTLAVLPWSVAMPSVV